MRPCIFYGALTAATWWAVLAVALLWWSPSLGFALDRLWGDRLRFQLTLGLGRTLVVAGWSGVASRLYAAEMARAERRMRALRGWRGW